MAQGEWLWLREARTRLEHLGKLGGASGTNPLPVQAHVAHASPLLARQSSRQRKRSAVAHALIRTIWLAAEVQDGAAAQCGVRPAWLVNVLDRARVCAC